MTINELHLTELEKLSLECLIEGLYAEPGFSDVDARDIATRIGRDIKSVRGALASLVKKDLIMIDDPNDSGYRIIYLNTDYYHLHPNPEWQAAGVLWNSKNLA
jgi:DNA-binding MarR family transcriptional regulator